MSTPEKDTKSTVVDQDAESSVPSTESDGAILISKEELNDLGALLETFRNLLIEHEGRIGNIEGFLGSLVGSASETPEVAAKPTLHVVGKTEVDSPTVSEVVAPLETPNLAEAIESVEGTPEA